MGRYNTFHADETCPLCNRDADLAFQADIGHLEWSDYRRNETIPHGTCHEAVRPRRGRRLVAPFWASGLAACPHCKSDVWAKIHVVDATFVRAEIVDTLGLFEWAYVSARSVRYRLARQSSGRGAFAEVTEDTARARAANVPAAWRDAAEEGARAACREHDVPDLGVVVADVVGTYVDTTDDAMYVAGFIATARLLDPDSTFAPAYVDGAWTARREHR